MAEDRLELLESFVHDTIMPMLKTMEVDTTKIKDILKDNTHNIIQNSKIIRLDQIDKEEMEKRIDNIETKINKL